MREPRYNAIPCANASFDEVRRGAHMHRNSNPERLCDRCLARLAARVAQRPGVPGPGSTATPAPSSGGQGPSPVLASPSRLPLLDAGERGGPSVVGPALLAGSAATSAPEARTARGARSGIFDDGFLPDPVALVSGSKRPQPQYRTLEVRPAHHPHA